MDQGAQPERAPVAAETARGCSNRTHETRREQERALSRCRDKDVQAGGDGPSIPNVAATIARGLGPVK